jgi:hypothetical protein
VKRLGCEAAKPSIQHLQSESPGSVDTERVAEMEPVAVKWVNRLFTKNTALCQVVKTTYRV